MGQSFVESVIPLRAIKTAVELQHSHDNKPLLDSLISSGSSLQYLGADGQYHNFPEMFSTSAFLGNYNQAAGNVTAFEDEDGKVYLNATNTFASELDGRVIGSIELERASDKQLNVSIAEVDVNSGAITENEFKYITSGNGVKLGYTDGIVSVELVSSEAPFTTLMGKQLTAVVGCVGVFNASGQIIDGGVSLSDLVTSTVFAEHVSNMDLHVSEELQAAWNAKQVALTADQLVAVNSGITAVMVSQYDGYATGKLSVGGHTPTMNLVTDASGNVITEAKFDTATKINTVPTAVLNRVAIFTETGNVKDSGIVLGAFPSTGTVKEYVDTLVSSSVSGASYQGTFTYFGTQIQIESVEATEGDTAIAYLGSLTDLEGLLRGNYDGLTWTFEDVQPAPVGGAWFETDNLLTNVPVVAGRVIVKMDGVNPPALDVRPQTTMQLDNVTIGLNFAGAVSFVIKSLSSGKSVLNTITADGVAYEFTDDGGTDTSKTIKEVMVENLAASEPAFSKNTAFNKDFDTSSQSATSTQVIGNNDTRLSDSRPASDVFSWAKAENKPSYAFSEIGSKPTAISGYGITDAYTKTEIDAMLSALAQQGRIVYVAKYGNDANDGTRLKPMLTLDAANTKANTLHGGSTNRSAIMVLDSEIYTEDLTLNNRVYLIMGSSTFVGALVLGNFNYAQIHRHYPAAGGTTMVAKGGAEVSYYECQLHDARGLAGNLTSVINCSNTTNTSVLYFKCQMILTSESGRGFDDSSSTTGHTHITAEDIYLSTNSVGVRAQSANSHHVVTVHHILPLGAATGTTGFQITNAGGKIVATVNELSAATAWNCVTPSVGKGLILNCLAISGTRTGTAKIPTEPDVAGTLTLAAGDWSGTIATKTITGLTNSDIIKVAPVSKTDATNWATANIWTTQSGEIVTFTADTAPSTSIAVVYEITKGVTYTNYSVTNTLTNCTSNNSAASVSPGASYSATLTAASGYTLTGATASVTMGGVDITSTAYSAGVITISSVTGAIAITVSAIQSAPLVSVGQLITMNLDGTDRQYRVLKLSGEQAEVVCMANVGNSKFGANNTYAGSSLDTYLNSTWYDTLTAAAKAAIVSKTFNQDKWYGGTSGSPVYSGHYGTTVPGTESYSISKESATYGAQISRNIYALSIQDVIDYITNTDVGDGLLENYNIWNMFWNTTTQPSISDPSISNHLWLRSARWYSDSSSQAWHVGVFLGNVDGDYVNSSECTVRPALTIDLSMISWS